MNVSINSSNNSSPQPSAESISEKIGGVISTFQEFATLATHLRLDRESRGYIARLSYPLLRAIATLECAAAEVTKAPLSPARLGDVPEGVVGDLSVSFPHLMKEDRRRFPELASEIAAVAVQQREIGFLEVYNTGPYLNAVLDRRTFIPAVLSQVAELGALYGQTDTHRGEAAYIDFSSPNIGKSLHVGHAGSTIVGHVLSNIFDAAGYSVLRVNYIGDWGVAAAKLLQGVRTQGDPPRSLSPEEALDRYSTIYSTTSQRYKEEEALQQSVNHVLLQLQSRDSQTLDLLDSIRRRSVDGLNEIYAKLGVYFHAYVGESFYEESLADTISECLARGIAQQEATACPVVVDLCDKRLPSFVLAREDGTSTYLARDVASLRVRKELTAADISLYVVGSEQRLHLAQVIETATRMGYIAPGEAHHVVIGLLTKYGEKVSSRDGSSLALEGFLAFLEKEAATVIASRQPDMAIEEQRRLASQLARGALFFTFSQRNPDKGFEFDVQKIFALDGRSALYLQYAATRADSLLTKAGTANKEISALNWEEVCRLMPKAAEELVFEISRLPIAIENALQLRSPHPLADSGFRLAQRFNRFFNEVQVKGAEGDVGQFYRHLVKAFRQTLGNILTMINIEVPERI